MNEDNYYHGKKPKLAIGIQKPSYPLPEQNDYAGWCKEMIGRHCRENNIKHPDYEKDRSNDNSHSSKFLRAVGIRDYLANPDTKVAGN